MAKDTSTGPGDSDYPVTTWGTGEGVGSFKSPKGRGNTLDPRKRCAPPVGGTGKSKKQKAKAWPV